MNEIGKVLFDCDGVLVDSEPITHRVLRDDLVRRGLDLPQSRVEALFVGGTMQGVMDQSRRMGACLPDDWLEHINEQIFSALAAACRPVAGIDAVLDALDAAGIPYAVASNGPMAKMDVTLRCTGLWPRFSGHIYSAHECAAPKPAPDVYLKAAAGVAPARCIVVEDSITGARAGQAAGMTVFGFVDHTSRPKMAPYCTAMFDDMAALRALLGV